MSMGSSSTRDARASSISPCAFETAVKCGDCPTIVTFLMLFLIQRTQNKDSLALHLKLNELVSALHGASNRLIDVESLSEKELDTLHRYYAELTMLAKKASDVTESHSVEEARARHSIKNSGRRTAK